MVQLFKSAKKTSQQFKPYKIEVQIDSLDHKGRGVGRYQGKVIFVSNALPTEVVAALVTTEKKQFLEADLIKIITPSKDRVEPACKWYSTCGGCQLQHLSANAQIQEKQAFVSRLLVKAGVKTGVTQLNWQAPVQGDAWGYRNRTRLATWYEGKKDILHLGFRQYNSKKIVSIEQCLVISDQFNHLLPALRVCLNNLQHKKNVSHIEFNQISGHKVCLVKLTASLSDSDLALLQQCVEQNKCVLAIQINDQAPVFKNNLLVTETELFYSIKALELHFGLNDFVQVNSVLNQKMVDIALNWLALSKNDNVLDLFCGLGNFSLPIAQQVNSLLGVEGVSEMVDKANRNAKNNQLDNARFIKADLSDIDAQTDYNYQQFNKIVIDPSRQGAELICKTSANWAASHVLYIACEANALARDSQHLIAAGYKLDKIGLIDMFPHTAHVETMALFTR